MSGLTFARFQRALENPSSRPSTANLGVALAYAFLGVGWFLLSEFAATDTTGIALSNGLRAMYAVLFAALYLINSYGFHWHATYTFEQRSRSFDIGSVGATLGLAGLLVQFVFPLTGLVLAITGVACNVLGVSWGTFVYTYRKYAPS